MRDGCPFCDYAGPSPVLREFDWDGTNVYGKVFVIEPVNPVIPGHVLVIPKQHVCDFTDDSFIAGLVMEAAGTYAHEGGEVYRACNLITSRGWEATQTVMHLHVHIVPRREGDGFRLPWWTG